MHSSRNKPKAFVVVGPPSAERQCLVVAVINQPTPSSSQAFPILEYAEAPE